MTAYRELQEETGLSVPMPPHPFHIGQTRYDTQWGPKTVHWYWQHVDYETSVQNMGTPERATDGRAWFAWHELRDIQVKGHEAGKRPVYETLKIVDTLCLRPFRSSTAQARFWERQAANANQASIEVLQWSTMIPRAPGSAWIPTAGSAAGNMASAALATAALAHRLSCPSGSLCLPFWPDLLIVGGEAVGLGLKCCTLRGHK